MIKRIKAEDRFLKKMGWLEARWLFSFADYHDPENIHLGALRVFNDDIVQPRTGFGRHPHDNMEIVTIVLSGELTHEDSMGTRSVIKAGEVQRMTAGSGIVHSEKNEGEEPVNLYQIWFYPNVKNLDPEYEQKDFSKVDKTNRFIPIVAGSGGNGSLRIHSDSSIYLSDMKKGFETDYDIEKDRAVLIYVTSGSVSVNDVLLDPKDQARIADEKGITLRALQDASIVLIDVPVQYQW